jgi:hypothetical protein
MDTKYTYALPPEPTTKDKVAPPKELLGQMAMELLIGIPISREKSKDATFEAMEDD